MNRKATLFLFVFFVNFFSFNNAKSQTLPKVIAPKFKKDTFNILAFRAVADGITLNTKAIQSAIDACNKKGGGVVFVPKGFWATGPIEIKSNVNLHLAENALLQFTPDFSQYQLILNNWEGLQAYRNQSPIYANNAINIAVTGKGIVDGNGDAWRMVKKEKLTTTQWEAKIASGGILSDDKKTWYPTIKSLKGSKIKNAGVVANGATLQSVEEYKDFLRPNLLVFTKCKNILLEGVTFQNSPAWNLHPLMCENLIVRNIYAKNPWYAQNGDGIDIESCKNFIIESSTFDVGDDGICIKSGRDAEGRKRNMPTENGIIKNCTVYHAHGGFVIGSEMSGGARNLYVENCTFIGTDIGLRFKTTRGRGGIVEKIYINNIIMKDIAAEAILFDMYYMAKDPVALVGEKREPPVVEFKTVDETTPQFKDFYVKNIFCDGAEKTIFVRGIPEMHIQNINIENVVAKAKTAIDIQEASNINLNKIKILSTATNPIVYLLNSDNINLNQIEFTKNAEVFMQAQGSRIGIIKVANTKTENAKKKVEVSFGADVNKIQIN